MTFRAGSPIVLFAVILTRAGAAARRLHGRASTAASARSSTRSLGVAGAAPLPGAARRPRAAARTGRPTPSSLIVFSLAGWLLLYLILRTQTLLTHVLNPQGFHSAPWDVTFNTTSSFVTNTNWQYYGGETTMSYFSQMAGLTVQNFVSAAVGIVVAIALIRGIVAPQRRDASATSGRTWCAPSLYVLLPISVIGALRARLAGRHPELRRLPDGARRSRASPRRSRWARSPRRRRSRSSAPTAAASSTSTRRTRSRTRPAFTNFFEMLLDPAHPGGADLHVRAHGRQPPPGLGDLRGDDGDVPRRGRRRLHRRGSTARRPSTPPASHTHASPARPAATWRARSSASASPSSALFDVGHDRHLVRRGQRAIESFTGIGGAVPIANLSARRGRSSAASAPACTRCCSTSCWRCSSAG